MAKIEMDMSEYEAIKKCETLLEESLKREKETQIELKKLTDEKLKILEESKMKVTKTSRIIKTEQLLVKRDDHQIFHNLLVHLNIPYGQISSLMNNTLYISIDRLIDIFFTKHTTESTCDSVTQMVGLDDIKIELRNELKEQLDSDIKSKLKNANELLLEKPSLIEELRDLKSDNERLEKLSNLLTDDVKKLGKKINTQENTISKFEEIYKTINENKNVNIFQKPKLYNKFVSDFLTAIENKNNE